MSLRDATTIAVALVVIIFTSPFGEALSSTNSNDYPYSPHFAQSRAQMLDLLNHPLQIQLATGDLPLGSFLRLVRDRLVLMEGIRAVLPLGSFPEEDDAIGIRAHHTEAVAWLQSAEACGKTIAARPGITCYTCGGNHLDIDCPDDSGQESSQSVLALNSVLRSGGVAGATAVLEGYSFACRRMLDALGTSTSIDGSSSTVYHGWLEAHAERWSLLAERCRASGVGGDNPSAAAEAEYAACISMFYNWIDTEAATTGIRADMNDPTNVALMERLEALEPGYAAQRDKHSSFMAGISGASVSEANEKKAIAKVNAAAAYLVAKKKKDGKSGI